jgi:carbonic anhydrase/acetyltransferase-like protein (isoleucine patch superfamily)
MPPLPAVLLPARGPVEGLSGPIDALPLAEGTVGAHRAAALRAIGAVVVDPAQLDPGQRRLVLREDAVVTAAALQALLAIGAPGDHSLRVGGAVERLCARVRFGDDSPVVGILSDGAGEASARLAAAPAHEVPPGGRVVPFPLAPGQFADAEIELPVSDLLAAPLTHWLQLLWWNLLRLTPTLLRGLSSLNPWIALPRVCGAAWRAGSLRPMAVAAQVRRLDRGAEVHPSAVVEASWLGPGAKVGAGAIVRGCVLGAGAQVEEHGLVEGSVLAPGARVQRKAMVKFSLLRAGAMAGGYMQLGVLDENAAFKLTSALLDQSFGAPVEVRVDGRRCAAPYGLAGVCLGAGSVVGAGVMVAPGRIVPPGLQIMPSPNSVLRRIPSALRGRVVIMDGGLAPAVPGSGA